MKYCVLIVVLAICFSCKEKAPKELSIVVKNELAIDRAFETIELTNSQLSSLSSSFYKVIDDQTGAEQITQHIDKDEDGKTDVLLFQPSVSAKSQKVYTIIPTTKAEIDSTNIRCYSRFVPERTDDYAWENNRVAFRTYGPTAQKMKEEGVPGGTLSSGMDAWLKRVEYPIINKWYEKYTSGAGTYHEDTGEGLDNFHVGVSRGVGGTAVKVDTVYFISKNFVSYKTITNGPIRTSFILEYGTWNAGELQLTETKHISLDYGQNLSRHTVNMKGADTLSVGITLHKKDGAITTNEKAGWMSYWESFDDSALGQGFVVKGDSCLIGFDKYITDQKDQSNLYAHLRLNDNSITYYAGFGWRKSGQFNNKEEWEAYLNQFSECLKNPLIVTINN
ncbi:DUF4861 family protein [Spongiivirga citrea]|uniref:DUF4861 domain-containing protein n=1 Tax=Spongiivirga citrea TaxID=1481457 RepID=A0A6M0CP61_9FLAO|nr:DUF4861 family protein [Spongiivirga citrea]NER17844.1 DUF4861 domain-containing protein [Spongiivirga citrea]